MFELLVFESRVSGSHLRISRNPETAGFIAEDTKSTNGTWVNGRSLSSPVELNDSDKIELGTTVIEYSSVDYDSVDEAKAAHKDTSYTAPPTMMESQNRKF